MKVQTLFVCALCFPDWSRNLHQTRPRTALLMSSLVLGNYTLFSFSPSRVVHSVWATMIVWMMRENYRNCSVLCTLHLCISLCSLITNSSYRWTRACYASVVFLWASVLWSLHLYIQGGPKKRSLCVFKTPVGGLGATYAVHLRIIGKLVFDFLLVLIELVC